MSRTLNDEWSDVNNPNNSANMDDWANANNPNNENYINEDCDEDDDRNYEEHAHCRVNNFKPQSEEEKPYYGYEGVLEKNEDGKWFVILKKGDRSITSENYDRAEECISAIEQQYEGCNVIDMVITIDLDRAEVSSPYIILAKALKSALK